MTAPPNHGVGADEAGVFAFLAASLFALLVVQSSSGGAAPQKQPAKPKAVSSHVRADGKDGTSFAFRKAAVACLVRGEWNGGADDEPEISAEDWYTVAVICTSPPFAEHRWR